MGSPSARRGAGVRDLVAEVVQQPAAQPAAVARPSCGADATWASVGGVLAKVRVWYDKSSASDLAQARYNVNLKN